MLKKIAVADLKLGMFVHKLEGSWFDHPFWKARFIVDDAERLAAIKESRVRFVTIDTQKGLDPAEQKATPSVAKSKTGAPPAASRLQNIKRRAAVKVGSPLPVSMEEEVNAAAQIARQATDRLRKIFHDARLGKALDVRKVEPVVSDILASVRRNPQAFSGLMRCKLKNEEIFRHALSVSALMVALGNRMKLTATEVYNCGLAGLLLDIGVNYLPNTVDPWTGGRREGDQRIWQSHVVLGYRALQNDADLPQPVLDACLMHHERIDGTGYPQRRSGLEIPEIARMAAICDSFEFLLTGKMGRPGLDPAVAVNELRTQAGAFDEEILRMFIETVGLYPVGSFVELTSGKLAMVIDEDRDDPLRPVVQAFYSIDRRERILPHRIALSEKRTSETIVRIADLSGLELPHEEQLRELVFLSACRAKASP
jgi:HD-GYP domain-containing protein (c-di-GMP phosphodiesterase class II)